MIVAYGFPFLLAVNLLLEINILSSVNKQSSLFITFIFSPLAPSNPDTVSSDATETNAPASSFDEVSPYTTAATEHSVKKCNCSRVYDPVCASNQKSYYNPCRMKCEDPNLFILYLGNCLPF